MSKQVAIEQDGKVIETLPNAMFKVELENGHPDYAQLSKQAVHQVNLSYSQRSVASKYIEVYNQAMAYKHYKI